MSEYMVCNTLAEAVEVIETTFKAHICDIGDISPDSEAQLCYYEVEDAIGLIALVDGAPWNGIPAIYVPEANLSDTDKKSISNWLMFSAPDENGEMTCLREAGEGGDDED